MDDLIKRIYDLMYSPIITPYNLLENAKLSNYYYVSYYKGDTGLVAEMKCKMDEQDEAVFFYHFDNEDKLQTVYMQDGNGKNLVYDRQEEFNRAKKEVESSHNIASKSKVS